MKRFISLLICTIILLSACGRDGTPSTVAPMQDIYDLSTPEDNITLTMSDTDDSPAVSISTGDAAAISNHIEGMSREYRYAEFFETKEAYDRITAPVPKVTSHRFSALNDRGQLDADTLYDIVKKNNEEYLKGDDFAVRMSSAPEDDVITEFCGIIAETVNTMAEKYPDIDWDRVSCNLGNPKILNHAGMLSFAEVSTDLVMKVGKENRKMSEIATNGEDRYDDIIAHETMHIIQVGCTCEEIEGCNRRCGISRRYDDFEANTSDFNWLFEGGAEKSVCNLTGRDPTTYTTMIGYICSADLACMLREGVSVDGVETLSFYNDPQRLFSMFGCDEEEDCIEIMNMLIAVNVIQTNNEAVHKTYGEKYSVDMSLDDNINDLNRRLKPEICRTLSKQFYHNLAVALAGDEIITANDLCYLINLFEVSVDTHLQFTNNDMADYNEVFIEEYKKLRNMLFDAVNTECGVNIAHLYSNYNILNDGADRVNASMKWNDTDKNDFLLERTSYNIHRIERKIK